MPELDFFENVSTLEPKCPKCRVKIDYGITTRYNSKIKAHVCKKCGSVLE